MSDRDRKNVLDGLGEVDWDNALDDWEKTAFAPEIAKDADSAAVSADATPKPTGDPAAPTQSFTADGTLEMKADVPLAPTTEPLLPASAPVPLQDRLSPVPPPSSRGGLNQLFSKSPVPPPPGPARQSGHMRPAAPAIPPFERPSERTMVDAEIPAPTTDELPVEHGSEPPDDADTAERPIAKLEGDDEVVLEEKRKRSALDDDDDAETATLIRDRSQIPALISDALKAAGRPSTEPMAPVKVRRAPPRSPGPESGVEEPPAELTFTSRWLDPERTKTWAARTAWLEDEARRVADDTGRSRALLALSEICAITGDQERALAFATEARDIAPHLPLAWRQARQLLPPSPDLSSLLVEVLDAEAAKSPTASARAHAALLVADILRVNDDGDAAVERWDSACKLDPADARAPISRAALALAQNNHGSGSLRLADNSELITLDKSFATALRLRGVERPGAEVDDMPINDGLRHARVALASGDVVSAAQSIGEIAQLPELAHGAQWLSASFGAGHIASRRAAARALKTLTTEGEVLARRQLAARGIELGDPELVDAALQSGDAVDASFSGAERAVLKVLSTKGDIELDPSTFTDLGTDEALRALDDALWALQPAPSAEVAASRAKKVSGDADTRGLATVGRLLAARVPDSVADDALREVSNPGPSAWGIAIELAVRGKRWDELSATLSNLEATGTSADAAAQRHIAAALIAERTGDRERARRAWTSAVEGGVHHDGVLRLLADLDPNRDLPSGLLRLADEMKDGIASAVLRLEAIARGSLSEEQQASLLEHVHRSAPELGIGAFLAERLGRRQANVDEVLRWIDERRPYTNDPLEAALDAIREALLVADRDADLAASHLERAHKARPDDVALRELYERLAPSALPDRGAWRERRAATATPVTAPLLWIEAALEHERALDLESALRAARKAEELAPDQSVIARPIIERCEQLTGEIAGQTRRLTNIANTADDDVARREALERLAELESEGRKDNAAALGFHRRLLELLPAHKPSLRWMEQLFIGEGRDDELMTLFEAIARALDGSVGGESTGHAQLSARLRARGEAATESGTPASAWELTHDMVRLAAAQPEPSLWSIRELNAHGRAQRDEASVLKTTLTLLERTQRPPERATLLLRASESATRLEQIGEGRGYLEQAAGEDPSDIVTWGFLAELRAQAGDAREAAEAYESLARTSVVRQHQLLAWHDAARIWTEDLKDAERAMRALEAASQIDIVYGDVFPRLSALYTERGLDADLARLLETRLAIVEDEDERVGLEVELARAFAEMGDFAKAKASLERALEQRPDHTTALGVLADMSAREGDWTAAEQAYIRLARLLTEPADQKAMYERLGEIYSTHNPNLSRAETAYKEVLKQSPDDPDVLEKLVDVYQRQNDVANAVETQQALIGLAKDPESRLTRLVGLARIYETARDLRRSEQVLDSARKEFPTSVAALRTLAEFYARQRQMPAMQILLDRVAGDARRAFAQGRFVPALFQVLHTAFELRGKRDAARVVAASLGAFEGRPSELLGGDARAVDPRLDDVLAPDVMSPPLRALLYQAGGALDATVPVTGVKATPLPPGTPIGATVGSVATVTGLGALQILVSPTLGRIALPLSSNPPSLLVGEALARVKNERARMFVVVRALKMILANASALLRGSPEDIASLIAGTFTAFNPTYIPQGVDPKRVANLSQRIRTALPRNLDPTVGVIALEAAGMVGTQWAALGPAAAAWANRVALLAVGDPNSALEALAWGRNEDYPPNEPEARAAWIARHAEARDLMAFSVSDAYSEARSRLGLDR